MPVNFDYTAGISGAYSDIVYILLNSISSLFLCQATWTIFDLVVTRRKEDGALFKRINSITFVDGEKDEYSRDAKELFKYWPYQKFIEVLSYGLMLLSNGYVMTICVVEIILYFYIKIFIHNFPIIVYKYINGGNRL